MERSGKRELLRTIEHQKEQLSRYETKLRDIIQAYKGLSKEKEALESSLKALSVNQAEISDTSRESSHQSIVHENESIVEENTEEERKPQISHPLAQEPCERSPELEQLSSQEEGDVKQLQARLKTLTTSISTIAAEKSRIETSFQADKKKLRQEKEELESTLTETQQKLQKLQKEFPIQIEEVKALLGIERHEREKDQNDNAVMMRELQKVISDERHSREQLELQLQESQNQLKQWESQISQAEHYEHRIHELMADLEVARRTLRKMEVKAKESPPLLTELQREITELKAQHMVAIQQEQRQVLDAEELSRHLSMTHEERVANMEVRLQELSATVGKYDRLRQQDQGAIQKLKDRITQLELENSALAQVATVSHLTKSSPVDYDRQNNDDTNLDVHTLMEKLIKLKDLLKLANQRSENPVDIEGFLQLHQNLSGFCEKENHSACQDEYRQLKEEFEKYKAKAQSALRNRPCREDSRADEVETLKASIAELKERIRVLHGQLEDTEAAYQKKVDTLKNSLSSQKSRNKQEILQLESDFRTKVIDIEQQMQQQRERSLALLEDKDSEIKILKSSLEGCHRSVVGGDKTKDGNREEIDLNMSDEEKRIRVQKRSDSEDVAYRLSQMGMTKEEGHMLHYVQELARKDVEITNLRKAKHQLESGMREMQINFMEKEEKYQDESDVLRNEISRLERMCSREGANLEYLKNVVLSYMLSSDTGSRSHMLNAIAAVLKFSPPELESVRKYNALWWWQAGPKG